MIQLVTVILMDRQVLSVKRAMVNAHAKTMSEAEDAMLVKMALKDTLTAFVKQNAFFVDFSRFYI